MTFEHITNGLTGINGLIYHWEIFDKNSRVGVYIGLTDTADSKSRISRYRANVMGIHRNEPYYRKKTAIEKSIAHSRLLSALANALF